MLSKYIARQFGNPTGLGGVLSTFIMNRQNGDLYKSISDNINIQAGETILDIGFGNGFMIEKLLKSNPKKICGIDISSDMISRVGRKYASDIASGVLDIQLADIKTCLLQTTFSIRFTRLIPCTFGVIQSRVFLKSNAV